MVDDTYQALSGMWNWWNNNNNNEESETIDLQRARITEKKKYGCWTQKHTNTPDKTTMEWR